MKQQQRTKDGAYGRLPENAPLANAYVPLQTEDPPKYDARFGLVRGTIFPGLDLPFRGMVNQKELPVTPKTELQALGFAVNELALYLDTHPDDREALQLYRQYQKLYARNAEEFAQKCSTMTHAMPVEHNSYTWINDPWPWEYAANKEG